MSWDTTLEDCEPLAYDDEESTSYERTQNAGTIIRQLGRYVYRVRLTDSENPHIAVLAADWHGYVGACDCKGYAHHSGPCAHLWGLKEAEDHGVIEAAHVAIALDPTTASECPTCRRDAPEEAYARE